MLTSVFYATNPPSSDAFPPTSLLSPSTVEMGYFENACQLCAASTNVARLRTKTEPRSDGWGYGDDYYAGDESNCRCMLFPEKSGCSVGSNQAGPDELELEVHFPGPGCCFEGGYSGLRILAAEMKNMNTPRYLVRKPLRYRSGERKQEDELDYEKDSEFFITSMTETPPLDSDPGDLVNVRYGVQSFFPQNYMVQGDEDEEDGGPWGVPVHESCWKIFERVSKQKLGRVDLQGFMALWYRQACGNCMFNNMKQDPMIQKCREQWWIHIPGTEVFFDSIYIHL